MKKFLAFVLAMMMVFSLFVTVNAATPAFTDAAEASTVYQDALKALSSVGAMKGYDDGSVEPGAPIARKEFAAMLYRLLTGDVDEAEAGQYAQYAAVFTDVGTNKWYSGPVGYLYHNNIMVGVSETEFGKDNPVKAEHVIIALLRAVGLVVNDKELTDENPSGLSWGLVVNMAMNRATTFKLDAGVATKELSGAVTREVVAQLIFNAFTSPKYYPDPYATRPDQFVATKDTLGAAVGLVEDDNVPASAKNDPYGRPDAKKVIPIGEDDYIITERDETLIATFEGKTKAGEAVAALKAKGVTKFTDKSVTVYINGSTSNDGNVSGYIVGGGLNGKELDVKFVNTDALDGKPWKNKGVLDYYTSTDNTVVEVYATELKTTDENSKKEVGTGKYEITRIVSINTFVSEPLTKSQIEAAKGTTKAGIKLEGVKYETTDAYEEGDVVLYTKGLDDTKKPQTAKTVIMSAKKADSFEGKLESVTNKNGYTYTIDGVGYTASDAKGGSIDTTSMVGKDCVFYYLTDNDTRYLVYAELKPGEEEAPETGFIYITTSYEPVLIAGDGSDAGMLGDRTKYYTVRVYGVLNTAKKADFYTFVADESVLGGEKIEEIEKINGLFSYEVDDDGNMVLTANLDDSYKASNQTIAAGAQGIKYGNENNAVLDGSTVFLFVEMSTEEGKETTVDKVTVKTGSRNIGDGFEVKGGTTAYVCVENGMAVAVYVLSEFKPASNDSSDDVYVLLNTTDVEEKEAVGENGKAVTTYTYTGITSEGKDMTVTVSKKLTGTGYTNTSTKKAWVAYKLYDDGTVNTAAIKDNALYGALAQLVRGSLITFYTSKETKIDCYGVEPVAMGSDTELKLGQKVVAIYAKSATKDDEEETNTLVAAWIVEDQGPSVDVKYGEPDKKDEADKTQDTYTATITPVAKEFIASASDKAEDIVKNIFTVTVTKVPGTTKQQSEGDAEGTKVTVTYSLKDEGKIGDKPADSHDEITTTVTIPAGATTGSKLIWISSVGDVTITIKSAEAGK